MSWPSAPAPDPYITDPSFSIHIVGRNPYCEVSVQLATQVWSRSKYKYLMLHYLRSCRCLCTRMSVLSLISPTQRRYLDTSRYVHHSFLDARVSVWRLFFLEWALTCYCFFLDCGVSKVNTVNTTNLCLAYTKCVQYIRENELKIYKNRWLFSWNRLVWVTWWWGWHHPVPGVMKIFLRR